MTEQVDRQDGIQVNKKKPLSRRKFLLGSGLFVGGLVGLSALSRVGLGSAPWKHSRPKPTHRVVNGRGGKVEIRKFPYPYKAMIALTSDIDGTSPKEFERIHRFLNTKEETEVGRGLGLDVGDSFWMVVDTDWPGDIDVDGYGTMDQMSYWRGTDVNKPYQAAAIAKYIRCGWIDSVHSWGDYNKNDPSAPNALTFRRSVAEAAVKELNKQDLHVEVWIDHGNAANVHCFAGSDSLMHKYQKGDDPSSPFYHTDLTIPYGIRFGWAATRSAWEFDVGNDTLLHPLKLRDGQKIWNFDRYSSAGRNWRGKSKFIWNPYRLHRQLNEDNFHRWKTNGWYSCVAQHFGGPNELYAPFPEEAVEALRALAAEQETGEILVARTSRLLRYNLAEQFVDFTVTEKATEKMGTENAGGNSPTDVKYGIDIRRIADPHLGAFVPRMEDVRGMTFYVDEPDVYDITIAGKPIPAGELQRNPEDHTGRKSIGIRWFTPDWRDYTQISF